MPGEASESGVKISALLWVWFYDVFFLHGKNFASCFLPSSLGSRTMAPRFSSELDAPLFPLLWSPSPWVF